MKVRSVTPMRIAKIGCIALSLCMCILGLYFMTQPARSEMQGGMVLGVILLLFGGLRLAGYFSKDLFRLAFQYDLQFGVLMMVLGIATLLRPEQLLNALFFAWGIALLADGLFRVRVAYDSKRFGIPSWWMIMILSVCTTAMGAVLVLRPVEGQRMLGFSLLVEGILNLDVIVTTVKIIKHQYPDVIDMEDVR